jgi:Flp pilus assembly protein TadB
MTGIAVAVLLWTGCWFLHRSRLRYHQRSASAQSEYPKDRLEGLDDPALMMDLSAAMLAAGLPLDRCIEVLARSASPPIRSALTAVGTALDLGASWETAWAAVPRTHSAGAASELGDALRFAGTTGAPSAAVVTANAVQCRRRKNREAERRAAALGVRLVVPLGLCSLPAFVCLGVIPILVGLFPAFA